MTARADNPHRPALVAILIEPTVADRTWKTQKLEGEPCFRAFFLRHGAGLLTTPLSAPLEVTGLLLLWLPASTGGDFKLFAGGDGASFHASDDLVTRIVAESPIGAQLRRLFDRPLLAPGAELAAILPEIDSLFGALARESRDPGPGAPAMNGLYLGLLLTQLRRSRGLSREAHARDAGAPTAQRFRQLVELHYRDNLDVDDSGVFGDKERSRIVILPLDSVITLRPVAFSRRAALP